MARSSQCEHLVVFHGMCAECGATILEHTDSVPVISGAFSHQGLSVARKVAEASATAHSNRLKQQSKLALIVDLDKTVIHTVRRHYAEAWVHDAVPDLFEFALEGDTANYVTRIRPGTREALKALSHKFEMHVYTMGTRRYATEIMKEIDPTREIFSVNILTQDETFDKRTKSRNLESLFPGGDHMVAIIDDSAEAWHSRPNLLKVYPYSYFKGDDDVNVLQPNSKPIALDPYFAKLRQNSVEADTIELPANLREALVERHGVEVGSALAIALLLDARRIYQWQQANAKDELESTIRQLGLDFVDDELDAITTALITPTSVVHAIDLQKHLRDAVAYINVVLPELSVARGTSLHGPILTISSPSSSLTGFERSLLLRHIMCLRNIKQSENGTVTATLPIGCAHAVKSRTKKDECLAKLAQRVSWKQITSAVLLHRVFKLLLPGVLQPLDDRVDEVGFLMMFHTVYSQTEPTLAWPRPPEDRDSIVPSVREILERLHEKYYSLVPLHQSSVSTVLNQIMPEFPRYPLWILHRVNIAFTRVIPQGVPPEKHQMWLKAQFHGAVCHQNLNENVTHLLCGEPGTDKIREAFEKYPGLCVVHVSWLDACIEKGQRLPEEGFPVKNTPIRVPFKMRRSKDAASEDFRAKRARTDATTNDVHESSSESESSGDDIDENLEFSDEDDDERADDDVGENDLAALEARNQSESQPRSASSKSGARKVEQDSEQDLADEIRQALEHYASGDDDDASERDDYGENESAEEEEEYYDDENDGNDDDD